MKTYKELEVELIAKSELMRCRDEFVKLCSHLPNLASVEANFVQLMLYFEYDTFKFDCLSAAEAIGNDETFAKRLCYRTNEQIETDKQKAIKAANAAQLARPLSEIKGELRQRHREFLENSRPKPPASLTRKAYRSAPPPQMRKWLELYTGAVLDAHWAKQDEEAANAI